MDLVKLSAQDLERLFQVGCFFVLNDLPVGSEFSFDGVTWTTGPRFQGIKLIPPGFHIITIVSAPKHTSPPGSARPEISSSPRDQVTTLGIGYHVKKALLRFFKPQEIVVRSYDPLAEDFKCSSDEAEETITSLEYMKTLDPKLAPYPLERYGRWKALTNWIGANHVAQVVRFDGRDDALLDSIMANEVDLASHPMPDDAKTRTQWGKARPLEQPLHSLENKTRCQDRLTSWPAIDLKRSWPKESVGPELTKWSRDKSWLFDQVMRHQLDNDTSRFLGLMQLSFLTFVHVHSIQSFEFYQSIMNLLTRSTVQELDKLSPQYLTMIIEAVKVLSSQLAHLEVDFFSTMDDPQIENWFFDVVNKLRVSLKAIKASKATGSEAVSSAQVEEVQNKWWPEIQASCRRFDWNVQPLKQEDGNESEDSDEEYGMTSEEEEEYKPTIVQT